MSPYTIRFLREAESDYSREYRWSKKQWGAAHAKDFFDKIDLILRSLEDNPFLYNKHMKDGLEYRVVRMKGMHIAYHIDEDKRMVTVMAFIGRNRFFELEQMALDRTKNPRT